MGIFILVGIIVIGMFAIAMIATVDAKKDGDEAWRIGAFLACVLAGLSIENLILACSFAKDAAIYVEMSGQPIVELVTESDGSSSWQFVDEWRADVRRFMTKESPDASE